MRNFNVKVNGKTFFVEVEESDGFIQPAAPIEEAKKPIAEAPLQIKKEGGFSVVSPLPGLVLKLTVPAGSVVKKNDKIMVLEAMKMEHDILAGESGKIAFLVKQGDSIEAGIELAYIK